MNVTAFLQIDIYVASDMFCDSFEVKYPMSAKSQITYYSKNVLRS